MKPAAPEPSVEESLERIEALVREMESGKLPLDDVISRFEEGARLVKSCQARLDAAGRRIQAIVRDAGGAVAGIEDFEPREG